MVAPPFFIWLGSYVRFLTWLKNRLVPDYEKTIQLLHLQILLQDATIRELAVDMATLRDHIKYIEDESDIPIYDKSRLRATLKIHYGNLHELKEQAAIYAGTPPVELVNRINFTELEIDQIERRLKSG